MSSLTPVVTFSRSPTFPPFLPLPACPPPLPPFGLFRSAMNASNLPNRCHSEAPVCGARNLLICVELYSGQERSRIVELAGLPLRPGIKLRGIDQNLPIGREFDVRAVHRTRRRSFEVDSLAVVAATMAGALEFVFAWLPVRSTP